MPKYLASNGDKAIIIEAESIDVACQLGEDKLLLSEFDKKHGNVYVYNCPEDTKEAWEEFERQRCIAAGEFFEYYAYHNAFIVKAQDFAQEKLKAMNDLALKRDE